MKKIIGIDWLLIAIASMVFVLHAFLFRLWIVDDAGISFVYARNLARGYGLISQPGSIPVEGYSNFLWVLLLTPFFLLGVFHPIITPKLLSILLVLVSFIVIYKTILSLVNNRFISFIVLTLIATNTSFAVWTTSGLENPLYTLLFCLLLFWSVRYIVFEKTSRPNAIFLGFVAACIAMTRPEGIIYFGIFPLLLLTKRLNKQDMTYKQQEFNYVLYGLNFALLFGSFMVFRIVYFNDIFPNTFYAKCILLSRIFNRTVAQMQIQDIMSSVTGQLGFIALAGLVVAVVYFMLIKMRVMVYLRLIKRKHFALFIFLTLIFLSIFGYFLLSPEIMTKMATKLHDLVFGVAGQIWPVIFAGLMIITVYLILTRRFKREHFILSVFLVWTIFTYLLLPCDEKGECRFATVFFVFFYTYIVIITYAFIKSLNLKRSFRIFLLIPIITVFAGGHLFLFGKRSIRFAQRPAVPFTMVAECCGHRFNRYAARLGIRKGSILLPDTGGTLYYSRLKVYDLGMLCDKTIAKTLGKDQEAFYDYVFKIIKPTFIHTHDCWTVAAALDNDKRFRRDYIPIYEYRETETTYSGDYIRREAVENKIEEFYQIRNELK